MASYEYDYYICPKCKARLGAKTCPECKVKTKGQGKVSMRFRLVTVDGKKNKRTSWYKTKKEAKAEYLRTISDASKIDYRFKDGVSYLFEDMYKHFLAHASLGTKQSTLYEYTWVGNKYFMPKFRGQDIRKISKHFLIDWQTWLFTQTYKRKGKEYTISNAFGRKIRARLLTFFNWVFYKYNIPNILVGVKPPKSTQLKAPKDILELAEFRKLDEASQDDILWNTIFCFLFHTGLRTGECQVLSEDDYKNGEITIDKTLSRDKSGHLCLISPIKNYKRYSKPLDSFIIEKLSKYIQWKRENNIGRTFLFGGDTYIDRHKYERKLKHYLDKAGIKKNITLHCFRHSYVSMLVDMGCSSKTVAEMIGDTEEMILRTYSHLYSSKKHQTVDKLNEYLKNFGNNSGNKN